MRDALTQVTGSGASPRELLSGIDSLDLTCKSPAPAGLLADLGELKSEAGEKPREAVPFAVGDNVFRVAASGMGGWWPYRLDHRLGQLAVGESANRPAWKLSVSAEGLHTEGASAVVAFWTRTLEALTGGPVTLMVSRLDVHADFVGLNISEADRQAFVCRSGRQSVEISDGALQTLYWGKGGDVMVRIYDKLAEVQASGKGGYLLGAYGDAGIRDGEQVQRVEAQVRRDALRDMHDMSADDAIARAGEIYQYVVGSWLRLTDPGSATRRERAKLDRRWTVVQAARVAAGVDPAQRVSPDRHAPALGNIVPMLAGLFVSGGAALGVNDLETAGRQLIMLAGGYLEDRGRDFKAEVQARRLDLLPS
jgi:hypothetical protein